MVGNKKNCGYHRKTGQPPQNMGPTITLWVILVEYKWEAVKENVLADRITLEAKENNAYSYIRGKSNNL